MKKFYFFIFGLGIVAIVAVAVFGVRDAILQKQKKATVDIANGITPEVREKLEAKKKEFLALIKENDKLVVPYINLATVEKSLGNIDSAIDALLRAKIIAPKNHLVHGNLANLYMEKRINKEADESFQRAIEFGSQEMNNYLQYAEFLQYRYPERRDDILATYAKGLEALPGDVSLMRARAGYYTDSGDDKSALAEWKAILKKDPSNEPVRQVIQEIEARLNLMK